LKRILAWLLFLLCLPTAVLAYGVTAGYAELWSTPGDARGWRDSGGSSSPYQVNSGGNPGGYLRMDITSNLFGIARYTADDTFAVTSNFLGNYAAAGIDGFAFDLRGFNTTNVGGVFSITFNDSSWTDIWRHDLALPPNAWTRYVVPLSSPGWYGGTNWSGTLGDVASVDLEFSLTGTGAQFGLDNFTLTPVPEPPSPALLGAAWAAALLTLRRFRRKPRRAATGPSH